MFCLAEELLCEGGSFQIKTLNYNRERGDWVVLLDELKHKLSTYDEPLQNLRDSL